MKFIQRGLVLFLVLMLGCLLLNCKSSDDGYFNTIAGGDTDPSNLENCQGVNYPVWLNSPYVLPYPTSNSYLVRQSNCSPPEHAEGSPDQFAIDFAMSIGSVVSSAREGVVVHVSQNNSDDSAIPNKIVINHGDNTYANYKFLKQNGALVTVGDMLEKGVPIGLSGSSGTSQPQLHFVVTSGGWTDPYTSIPTTFFNTVSNPNSLIEGVYYLAEAY